MFELLPAREDALRDEPNYTAIWINIVSVVYSYKYLMPGMLPKQKR